MIEGIPRISVLVITYNQEDVICRAIDSLLIQRDYIYEICVSDDCSKDNTWNLLQEYNLKYPGLFKLNRNTPNKGIFENVEYTWDMPSGDIVYRLAGDDECGEGWFEKVVHFIQENHIDYKNELFAIYGDYRAIYPNGDSFIFSNRMVATEFPALKLSIRGLIGNRSACFSIQILHRYEKVSKGFSYIAEAAQDRQLQMLSENNYYIEYVGNIYYARIGVSMNMDNKIRADRADRFLYFLQTAGNRGITFDSKDTAYIYYLTAKEKKEIIKMKNWFKSIEPKLFFSSVKLRRYFFAFLRRLPHSKPIKDFKL